MKDREDNDGFKSRFDQQSDPREYEEDNYCVGQTLEKGRETARWTSQNEARMKIERREMENLKQRYADGRRKWPLGAPIYYAVHRGPATVLLTAGVGFLITH